MEAYFSRVWLLVALVSVSSRVTAARDLPQEIIDDIASNKEDVEQIMDYLLEGEGKGQTYKRLSHVDEMGPRLSGTEALEDSIDNILARLTDEGFDNVDGEELDVPNWERGEEWAEMIQPRHHRMEILAFLNSVSTNGVLEADVVVVRSFDELETVDAVGKIVVYNQEWVGYGGSVVYRREGAAKASAAGAIASLTKSVTQFSIYSPHTGSQTYEDEFTKIPTGAVTVEDAELMQRLQLREIPVRIRLFMDHTTHPDSKSRNVVAEIRGSLYPNEVVMIGGHIDSWDVGTGAMDDAGGCIISWEVLTVIKALGLRPKRTIRVVMWTAEEVGIVGGNEYYNRHKHEADNISLAMESDSGTWAPVGIGLVGSGLARAIIEEILEQFLGPINATTVTTSGPPADIGMWEDDGVPLGSHLNHNDDYFFFHHSHGDTMTLEDPVELDMNSVLWAVTTYVVANLEDMLPREGDYPTGPPPVPGSTVSGSAMVLSSLTWTCLTVLTLSSTFIGQ